MILNCKIKNGRNAYKIEGTQIGGMDLEIGRPVYGQNKLEKMFKKN